jgi:hypothetical protein
MKLRQDYEHRLHRRITMLRQKFRWLKLKDNNLLTSLSDNTSESLSLELSSESTNEMDVDDALAELWSPSASIDSLAWEISDDGLVSSSSASSISGYSGDDESDFDSDMLDFDGSSDEESETLESGEEGSLDLGMDSVFAPGDRWSRLQRWVYQEIRTMYAHWYEIPRDDLPRGPSFMHHALVTLKSVRADKFREELRVTPQTFDTILSAIEYDPIFTNNSNNQQMAVEEQLAITLYRFGHDGNAASLQSIANWAGSGKGTVQLATRHVMTSILRQEFMNNAVCFPTPHEKEDAKKWIQEHSCWGWRNGWSFVDGTLVPLAQWPHWFGESYFDRKMRYSMNVQVREILPNRMSQFSLSTHRLSHCPTYASLTSPMGTREAPMIQLHGPRHDCQKSMTTS